MVDARKELQELAVKNKTNRVIEKIQEERTPIATTENDGLFIPNLSGQHDAGTTKTPVTDVDIANKKYVDDTAGAGGVDWEADQSPKVINAANYVDNDTQLVEADITTMGFTKDVEVDWTVTQAPAVIHATNYTDTGDTTYTAGDFAHDSLASIPANDHIDWTNATDNFSTTGTIHSNGNITTNGTVDGIDIAGMSAFVTSNSAHRGDATGADHSDIVTAVGLNTAKDTNVSTDLSAGTRAPTTIDVNSSDGSNATLIEADTTNAGILGSDKWDEIVANSLKDTDVDHNVTTNLSAGTLAATTIDVNSSDGTNATLAQADTTNAGVLSAVKWDEIVANSLKDTNVSTNITIVEAPTNVDVQSSDGSNDTIAAANVTNAGVMTTTMYDEHVVNTAHAIDNTQAHTDYLLNSGADVAVGPLTVTADNSTADQAYVPMVLYNTDDTPPAASGFPVGTLYVQYTA